MSTEDERRSRDAFMREAFVTRIRDPRVWYAKGWTLKRLADHVCWLDKEGRVRTQDHPLGGDLYFMIPTYMMLLGYAFENMFKGLLVAFGREPVDERERLTSTFKTHRLTRLAGHLCEIVDVNEEEQEFLGRLEKTVRWAGRYPGPLEAEEMDLIGHGNADVRIGEELWNKLESLMEEWIRSTKTFTN